MLLTQDQLDEFHLRGFVKGSRVLDDGQVETLREELRRVMEGRTERKPIRQTNLLDNSEKAKQTGQDTIVQVVNIWEASTPFLELVKHPEITATVSRLCNNTDTLRVWHDQIQYKPPHTGGMLDWHQDHPAWPMIVPADLVSAWVALDDVEVENGCMWMVPGSHRWGKVPLVTDPDGTVSPDASCLPEGVEVRIEPVPVKKGEVCFHHCMTWHNSRANKTDRPRRAFATHYMPGYTIYHPQRYHPMEQRVQVKPGEVLAGPGFPVVYRRERAGQPAPVEEPLYA